MKMSVIVPTHGRVDLFYETLESLINQTSKDFEIIVTDDSATEEEREAIQEIVKKGQEKTKNISIKYVFTKPNLLQAKNTNQGLENASGDYLRILHSDDILAPNCIEKEIEAFETYPNCGFLNHRARHFSDTVEFEADTEITFGEFNIFDHWIKQGIFTGCILPSSMAFRREVYQAVGGMNDEYKFLCDWDFFFRIIFNEYLSQRSSAIYVSGSLVAWRIHENQITSTMALTHFYEHEKFIKDMSGIYERYEILKRRDLRRAINIATDYRYNRILDDYKKYNNFILPEIPRKYLKGKKYQRLVHKINKLKKHILLFLDPALYVWKWVTQPVSIVFYMFAILFAFINYMFSREEVK